MYRATHMATEQAINLFTPRCWRHTHRLWSYLCTSSQTCQWIRIWFALSLYHTNCVRTYRCRVRAAPLSQRWDRNGWGRVEIPGWANRQATAAASADAFRVHGASARGASCNTVTTIINNLLIITIIIITIVTLIITLNMAFNGFFKNTSSLHKSRCKHE
jgi:hypothetical protein